MYGARIVPARIQKLGPAVALGSIRTSIPVEEDHFEIPAEEIDQLLEEIRKPKRVWRKSKLKSFEQFCLA